VDHAANLHVVVLDADPGWTAAVRQVLARVGRPLVEATTAEQASGLIQSLGASLLVVGPSSTADLDWLRGARKEGHLLHVIVVVGEATAETAGAAFAAGATAVISGSFAAGNLASAVAIAAATTEAEAEATGERFALSVRELEILELVTRGSSNAQIARALWVSDQTIKFHLSRIYRKLGVSSRTEAAWVARSQGLVAEAQASAGPAQRP
jgi:DNA-binding NarL/FixJ family response regulator